jgi:hypothetical protein
VSDETGFNPLPPNDKRIKYDEFIEKPSSEPLTQFFEKVVSPNVFKLRMFIIPLGVVFFFINVVKMTELHPRNQGIKDIKTSVLKASNKLEQTI